MSNEKAPNTVVSGFATLRAILYGTPEHPTPIDRQGWRIAQRPADRIVRKLGLLSQKKIDDCTGAEEKIAERSRQEAAYRRAITNVTFNEVLPDMVAPDSEYPLLHRAIARVALDARKRRSRNQPDTHTDLREIMLDIASEHEQTRRTMLPARQEEALCAFAELAQDIEAETQA